MTMSLAPHTQMTMSGRLDHKKRSLGLLRIFGLCSELTLGQMGFHKAQRPIDLLGRYTALGHALGQGRF